MRILSLAILVIGIASATLPARAQMFTPDYPVCLHYSDTIAYYECRYTSLAQCQASASGRSAQCVINPYFAAAGWDQPQAPPYTWRRRY